MKFTIPTKKLVAVLATLKSIAKPSTTHAILSNVRITATKDGIELMAMDLEKQLSVRVECAVSKQGSTTLSCAKLHDSLSKARGTDSVFETNAAHETTIRVGAAVSKLRGLPPEDMPPCIESGEGFTATIPAHLLNSCLTKSLSHSATDKTKAQLMSVCVRRRNGKMSFQATNRNRAIMCDTEIAFDTGSQYIIPKESVPMITSLATEGDVELLFSEGALTARTENCTFATKLIEGILPDFERVFRAESPIKVVALKDDLLKVIDYAQAQVPIDALKIAVKCDGNSITASGSGVINNAEEAFMDVNEDTMPAGEGSGAIDFKINPSFLRDALKCMDGDTVKLEIKDPKEPIMIREEGVICMIVPMVG